MTTPLLRVFIAVDISSEEVLSNLGRARDLLTSTGADLRPVATENLHITMRFIGETPSDLVNNICSELENLEFKPFRVVVKGIGVFPNITRPRVIWAGITEGFEELNRIHSDIEKMLKKLHIPPSREKFIPHITLARVKSGRNLSKLIKTINNIVDMDFGEFMVEEVVLKRSVLTPSGPIYSNICSCKARK